MKKSLFLLSAVSLVYFASCGDGEGTLSQEQLDSLEQVRITDSLMADSIARAHIVDSLRIADSTQNSLDSIAAVKSGKKYVAPPRKSKPATPTTEPTPASEPEKPKSSGAGMRGNSDQSQTSSGTGMRGNSDQSKQAGSSSSSQGMRGNSDQNK